MKVTAIIATSGGAGASSVSIYVAKMLSLLNKKVLIVDFNSASEIIKQITVPNNKNWFQTLNTAEFDVQNCINSTKFTDVDVISLSHQGSYDSCNVEKDILDAELYDSILLNLKEKYDHVILDCSVGFSRLSQKAMAISTQIIAIIEARPQGISGIATFLNRVAQARIGKPLKCLKLILNKVDVKNNACRIAIRQYQRIIDTSMNSAVYLPAFEYVKNKDKYRLKLPINALKKLAHILDQPQQIESNKIIRSESNNSLKNKINTIISDIYSGTAVKNHLNIEASTNNELNIDEFDELAIQSSELSENIEEFFTFIQQQNLGDAAVIVDEQGLLIAQKGDMNEYLNHLTVGFNQYAQLLEFSNLNHMDNGLWIKAENRYYYLTAINITEHFYGLIISCQNKIAATHISKLNTLLNTVIAKGINYE